ncbi:hypothetical protein CAXC1_120002 [Candidatus Xenohaliotis californiensis]|uniref:Uncharacterized protein n=1 Tax=Candidatus Xenohaliotis californiensis TaxID=84677 RepID=A0ABM9N6Y1_9RICK|nr:hypothetical protein CAXC1_120002 [Candidatus Xenohaliotis californiensis]
MPSINPINTLTMLANRSQETTIDYSSSSIDYSPDIDIAAATGATGGAGVFASMVLFFIYTYCRYRRNLEIHEHQRGFFSWCVNFLAMRFRGVRSSSTGANVIDIGRLEEEDSQHGSEVRGSSADSALIINAVASSVGEKDYYVNLTFDKNSGKYTCLAKGLGNVSMRLHIDKENAEFHIQSVEDCKSCEKNSVNTSDDLDCTDGGSDNLKLFVKINKDKTITMKMFNKGEFFADVNIGSFYKEIGSLFLGEGQQFMQNLSMEYL